MNALLEAKICEETRRILEKQSYHFTGKHKHSAVKACLWLKKSIRGEGNCYKGKFYGISSHRCVQMTPSIFCNQRCLHCWRPLEAFNMKELEFAHSSQLIWDNPEDIVEDCIREQRRLISGYKGFSKIDMEDFDEANIPKHAAISLIGESTLYPYLKELIEEFHKRGMTTFVVTNGTNPDMLREISPSQLYISLNASNESTYEKISLSNMWSRIKKSLEVMKTKKTRAVIRITCIKGLNMMKPEEYAKLILVGEPDFIEVKAYMHIGYSRKRLSRDAMPSHSEVKKFAAEIASHTSAEGYKIADESEISRVVLISKTENLSV